MESNVIRKGAKRRSCLLSLDAEDQSYQGRLGLQHTSLDLPPILQLLTIILSQWAKEVVRPRFTQVISLTPEMMTLPRAHLMKTFLSWVPSLTIVTSRVQFPVKNTNLPVILFGGAEVYEYSSSLSFEDILSILVHYFLL